jgi:serine protease Do
VEKNGPADKAGIEASDVILKVNDKPVNNSGELPRIIAAIKPGTKVDVELWRKGATKHVSVIVAAMPEDGKQLQVVRKQSEGLGEEVGRMGIAVSELTREQQQELQINGGLVITDVKGAAARAAGLRPGDVLLAIGNIQIRSLGEFNEILKQAPKGRNVALLVRRGDFALYVALKLDEQ